MNLEKRLFPSLKKTLNRIFFSSLIPTLISCPPVGESIKGPTISSDTEIVSEEQQNISYLEEDKITLSSSVDYFSVGDILVSGVTPTTPEGLLRKISGISSDGKTVYTSPATIEEIAKNYSVDFSIDLKEDKAISRSLSEGVSKSSKGFDIFDFNFDIDKTFDLDGNPETLWDKITLEGNVSLNSSLDIKWGVDDNFTLNSFEFTNTTSNEINLVASALQDLSDINKTVELARYDFPPITFTLPTTPPIPIVITPLLEINLDLSGEISPVILNLNQNANLVLGTKYSNGEWNPIKEFENSFSESNLSFPSLELTLGASERLSTNIYGFAGPYAEANEYLKFLLEPDYWKILGGINGKVGAKIEFFGRTITDYDKTLFEWEKVLKENFISEPEEPGPEPIIRTITIQPGPEGKDAYVQIDEFDDPSANIYAGYGHSEFLEVARYYWRSHVGYEAYALIQFPLVEIPLNSRIVSAKLGLYGLGADIRDNPAVYAYKILSEWDESKVSWDNQPPYSSSISVTSLSGGEKWFEWNLNSTVQEWVNNPSSNYGLALSTRYNRLYSEKGFRSGDYSDSIYRPKLEIIYETYED